ncbi:uncharacterized protein LOC133183641 [Saccostrea echinata]|uniref:uncharacterized protein LOC133183641 n=1 Tax=Saccostrea echinata TaxID=191078 RepID=UPI002A81460C|nr:uncharacterized protein LOC133183641 [Saccostrea echinata]
MGLSNIVLTVFPLAVGIFGFYLWRRETLKRAGKGKATNDEDGETPTKDPPSNIDEPVTNVKSSKPPQVLPVDQNTEIKTLEHETSQTVLYERNVSNFEQGRRQTVLYKRNKTKKGSSVNQNNDPGDLEVDTPLSMDADLIPSTPPMHSKMVTQSNCGYQEIPAETHDALILYAEKDAPLAEQLQKDLVANVNLPNLNVILYEEFAPEVQSHFGTMTVLFQRCRYLLVLVTKNFTEASFSRFQHEIALKDSIENPEKNERVIPVWGEIGAKDIVVELSVFKGIDYSLSLQKDDRSRVFIQFEKAFEYGRKKIKMF